MNRVTNIKPSSRLRKHVLVFVYAVSQPAALGPRCR